MDRKTNWSRGAWPLLVAAAVVLADQATKWAVTAALGPSKIEHRREVAGRVLALHYVENSGAAFGMLAGRVAFLSIVAAVVVGALIVFYGRASSPSPIVALGFGALLGGALGNLLDRVRLGYVIDYVAVGPWPKFNVADSAITVALLLFAFHAVRPASGDVAKQRTGDEGTLEPRERNREAPLPPVLGSVGLDSDG